MLKLTTDKHEASRGLSATRLMQGVYRGGAKYHVTKRPAVQVTRQPMVAISREPLTNYRVRRRRQSIAGQ